MWKRGRRLFVAERLVCSATNDVAGKVLLEAEAAIEMLDHAVTFACCVFQFFAIQNPDSAAHIFDQSGAFQYACGKGHSWTPATQHLGKKFMRERQYFRIHAVLAHEQPTCQALLQLMQAVTCGHLSYL